MQQPKTKHDRSAYEQSVDRLASAMREMLRMGPAQDGNVGTNSSANARREMKPAALSSRRVEAKARARASAARLPATAPRIPRQRDEVFPRTCSMGPSSPAAHDIKDGKLTRSAWCKLNRNCP